MRKAVKLFSAIAICPLTLPPSLPPGWGEGWGGGTFIE